MFKTLLLTVVGIAIGVAVVEAGMRLARLSYPSLYMPNEYLGSVLRPGAAGWWRREGLAYVKISSAGLRDREYSREKPANTLRIAVLGDSFAEALQVSAESAFWSVVERDLATCEGVGERAVEVINFGKSGRGTAEELLAFRHYASKYSPDIVLLAFWPGNDMRNNSKTLEPDKLRPFFVYEDGKLVLDRAFAQDPGFKAQLRTARRWEWRVWNWLRDRSRVVQLIDYAQDGMRRGRAGAQTKTGVSTKASPTKDQGADVLSAVAQEQGVSMQAAYSEPARPVWREAWAITEALITLTRDEVTRTGAEFLVVLVSTAIQVHPDPELRRAFERQSGVSDIQYSNRRILALGQRSDTAVLDLVPGMRDFADRTGQCLHGFDNTKPCAGHWNVAAHRVAGTLIAGHLCQNLISRRTP